MKPLPWPWPRVLAHRCGGLLAPENTLAGLNAAQAVGCGGVEFDVMLSGDGSAFVIHDETLGRTTDGSGEVSEASDESLNALDAGSWFDPRFAGERIPRFEHVARRCIGLGLAANVEIKPAPGWDAPTARVVASAAAEFWRGERSLPLLSSFSDIALAVAAEIAPHLPRGLLVEAVPDDWSARCRKLGVVALHAEASQMSEALARAIRAEGLWLVVYTENDPACAMRLLAWGVDCIITDRPDIVRMASA